MDTISIRNFITPYQRQNIFKGVFPCDALPKKFSLPAAFVINLSEHDEPGSHWVALYINNLGYAYYFDSFGFNIKNYFIRMFLKIHARKIFFNHKQLQHISSRKCGQFCCAFIVCLLKECTVDDFLNRFSKNLYVNELIIQNMINYLNKES